jgi:transcriptional regulator with XRE-family HTH domain
MKFTNRHKFRRELLGLTQKDIAEALKLSVATISAYELDKLDNMSEFVINGIKDYYNKLPIVVGLTDSENRLLRIAENALCAWYEEIDDYRLGTLANVQIDVAFAIKNELGLLNNDTKKKQKPYIMK